IGPCGAPPGCPLSWTRSVAMVELCWPTTSAEYHTTSPNVDTVSRRNSRSIRPRHQSVVARQTKADRLTASIARGSLFAILPVGSTNATTLTTAPKIPIRVPNSVHSLADERVPAPSGPCSVLFTPFPSGQLPYPVVQTRSATTQRYSLLTTGSRSRTP